MTDKEFWESTPRKVGELFKIHAKFNSRQPSQEEQEERASIDELAFMQ